MSRVIEQDEEGDVLVVYHGTSRRFEVLDPEAQEEAAFGSGFYFTEDRDVARGYAEMRHVPPIEGFANDAELAAFLRDHPGWEVVHVSRPGGQLVVQFRNDEHRPTVIHARIDLRRALDLDGAPEVLLVSGVCERLGGVPVADPATALELFEAVVGKFEADGMDEGAARSAANALFAELGVDGLTFVDRRYGNDDRVWVAFDISRVREIRRELLD